MFRMWQVAQLGFTVGARKNGRRQSSPRPGDIKIHLQQHKRKWNTKPKQIKPL